MKIADFGLFKAAGGGAGSVGAGAGGASLAAPHGHLQQAGPIAHKHMRVTIETCNILAATDFLTFKLLIF